ncbi:hypothetical protein ICU_04712 [Bacillus cereus BAG2X1-1]|nr:hypothetical protein ICU_04712 [Bacillus cereus BAG2X1-1]
MFISYLIKEDRKEEVGRDRKDLSFIRMGHEIVIP